MNGRLGDPVHVRHAGMLIAPAGEPWAKGGRVEPLAPEDDQPQAVEAGGSLLIGVGQGRQRGGRLAQDRDPLAVDQVEQLVGRAGHVVVHDDEAPTEQQRPHISHTEKSKA